jgi:hypothetical protein
VGRENKPGEPAADSQEDFLARWSRRKLDRDDPEVPGNAAAAVTPSVTADGGPERELTDADMPPIETLDADSDYAGFLSPGVSDDLRQQALRKLFSQPDFNITDGLNDYDEDFTQFAGLGSIVTHEMKRLLQRELEKERTASAAAAESPAEPGSHEAAVELIENTANEVAEPRDGPEDTDTKRSPDEGR